jgi:hypothetical protein
MLKRVKCPGCKQVIWETTDKYNPDVRPNGSMLKLVDPWKSWRWDTYNDGCLPTVGTSCALMNCPACGAALAPSGRLTVMESEEPRAGGAVTCEICGKICGSRAGLGAHMRKHTGEAMS